MSTESNVPTPPSTPAAETQAPKPGVPQELKLISHSNLFYWWPIWFLAFFMAFWTWVEDKRLAIVPASGEVEKTGPGQYQMKFPGGKTTESLENAVLNSAPGSDSPAFRARVSEQSALGAVFLIGLILTIIITNIPLRGLWSFIIIILIVLVALTISVMQAWDSIFSAIGSLHIYINLAGYLFIGVAVLILWATATFIFDRRSYIIFTPGQIKVCEHIGAAVQTYNTIGVSLEKQRDDLFRHYILGFGSGDLIVHTPGNDRRDIKLPNVLGIGWRLRTVEDMIRTIPGQRSN